MPETPAGGGNARDPHGGGYAVALAGAAKTLEGAQKTLEGAQKTLEGAWKTLEGAWKTLEGAALNPQVEPSQNFRDPGAATLQRRDYNARCYEMYCINTGCAPSCELYHIKVWYELHYN